MVRKNAILAVTLTSLGMVACDRADETTSPLGSLDAAVVVAAEAATNPVTVARSVPSFGGMYLDDFGRPTVFLTDLADTDHARNALREFAEENGRAASEIQFVQARYQISQLNSWYERTWGKVMENAGTVFSDLDESSNRIVFGVERAGLATAVNAVMRAHGVPADAYEVRVVEPIKLAATLRDVVNPKVGGLQIHFGNYLCTLGFNVSANNVASFVTNSHCTNTQGGVEGTVYYQPTSTAAPTSIATEVADPLYFKGGVCPRGKKCRYSDSSRAQYQNNTAFDLGGIAATSGSNLTITGTHNITNEADANRTPVAVGANVSKTGRTTGTSTGQVTNTCVNTSVQGSQIMQLCQTFVAAAVGSGDSGSPVYSGSGSVTLVGILWGGGTNTFVFSPLRSIKDELGAFTAH
jgi:hypothetical protein